MKSFKQFVINEQTPIQTIKVNKFIAALQSPHHTKEDVDLAMKHENPYVVTTALESPHHTKEHVDWAMKHENPYVVVEALKSPHHTKEHIDLAMKHSSAYVVTTALQSPHHTKEHVDLAMGHRDSYVVTTVLQSPHHTKEHVDWAMNLGMKYEQLGQYTVRKALNSPHHTKEHVDLGVGHNDPGIVAEALKSPLATKEHVDSSLSRVNWKIFPNARWSSNLRIRSVHELVLAALGTKHVSEKDIGEAIDTDDYTIRDAAIKSPSLSRERYNSIFTTIINNDKHPKYISSIMESHHTTETQLKKLLKHKSKLVQDHARTELEYRLQRNKNKNK